MQTDVMEDYLKVIYRLEREDGTPVGTSAIADALDVTAPTATRMLEKLADEELIEREKYSGVELTEHGRAIALETVRHHRLLEAYLVEHLGYEWEEVHDEAERLEHHISESFEERIADLLGHPPVDPHGEPIPGVDLEPPAAADTRPLSACEAGETVVVATVRDRDEETLQYLAESGIVPGREVAVTDVTPVDVYVLEHDEGTQHLSAAVAESVYVETPPAEGESVPEEVPGL
ncbi:metal-dependent transcriptional regulator [Halorhabdus sp. BNX81]|uniref:metal-dependent transcriptional regulator n=1 Tax=Halorhabdus sp. BNX81 TaxID=2980181 RepID=UPI0023DD661A|nr:metal-dependent transcriptional regulator [Halorhabdus sp. BNX81]WEL22532.1 Mn-dependent transcriptional regulator (DtxR family) [Halorhabdus sp. BNX81]